MQHHDDRELGRRYERPLDRLDGGEAFVSNAIALVGGSGFIGSRLADTLVQRGFEVRILDLVPSAEFPKLYRPLDVRDAARMPAGTRGIRPGH